MLNINEKILELVEGIMKPSRKTYNMNDQGNCIFWSNYTTINRFDIEISTRDGEFISGSLYLPENSSNKKKCLIYCHSFGGSRLEGIPVMRTGVEMGLSVLLFDSPGSGNSSGEFLTFGYREKDYIIDIMNYLESATEINEYVLWGKSMGASAILLALPNLTSKKINCIIADSPFNKFNDLVTELVNSKIMIPEFLISIGWKFVNKLLRNKYKIDLSSIDVSQGIRYLNSPILFICSKTDKIVNYSHTQNLFNSFNGTKQMYLISEEHNESRKQQLYEKAKNFISDFGNLNIFERKKSDSFINSKPIQSPKGKFGFLNSNISTYESISVTVSNKNPQKFAKSKVPFYYSPKLKTEVADHMIKHKPNRSQGVGYRTLSSSSVKNDSNEIYFPKNHSKYKSFSKMDFHPTSPRSNNYKQTSSTSNEMSDEFNYFNESITRRKLKQLFKNPNPQLIKF